MLQEAASATLCFKDLFLTFIRVYVSLCIYIPPAFGSPQRPQGGIRSPRTGVIGMCGCWEPNFRSSWRTASALNWWAIAPAPKFKLVDRALKPATVWMWSVLQGCLLESLWPQCGVNEGRFCGTCEVSREPNPWTSLNSCPYKLSAMMPHSRKLCHPGDVTRTGV